MTIQRMEHVGIVVDDLAAATAFFVELGLKLQGEGPVEGGWVDRVVGLGGVRAEIAMVETPDGHGRLELTKFHAPSGPGGDRYAPANTPGIRHVAFAVDDIDAVVASLRARGAELLGQMERYEDSYRLCYVRGPEGIIVGLAEQIGGGLRPAPTASPASVVMPRQDPLHDVRVRSVRTRDGGSAQPGTTPQRRTHIPRLGGPRWPTKVDHRTTPTPADTTEGA
jgi:catechol 2,3-dioxygenase-like lactoylglutathione lyase family enzyme